jgi:hypothetical protein
VRGNMALSTVSDSDTVSRGHATDLHAHCCAGAARAHGAVATLAAQRSRLASAGQPCVYMSPVCVLLSQAGQPGSYSVLDKPLVQPHEGPECERLIGAIIMAWSCTNLVIVNGLALGRTLKCVLSSRLSERACSPHGK